MIEHRNISSSFPPPPEVYDHPALLLYTEQLITVISWRKYLFFSQDKTKPLWISRKVFLFCKRTNWNIRLAPIFYHILPLLLLTQALFLKSHTGVWLLHSWMPFLHPQEPCLPSLPQFPSWHQPLGLHPACLIGGDLPVVTVSQPRDAIYRENAVVSAWLEVSFSSPVGFPLSKMFWLSGIV